MADIKTLSGKEYHLCWCEDGGVEDLEIKINHAQGNKQFTTFYNKDTHDGIATNKLRDVVDKIIEKNLKEKDSKEKNLKEKDTKNA